MNIIALTNPLKYTYFVLFLFILIGCRTSETKEVKKPNVLFILADDFGYHDLGVTGSNYYNTPMLDSLAQASFRFSQGYAASRVCSPSRASIMTGQFTATHGITDWIGAAIGENWRSPIHEDKLLPPDYQRFLKSDWKTLPEAFKDAGYSTFFAGKWHLGGEGNGPLENGFNFNKGGWDRGSPIGGYFSPWENPYLENTIPGENLSMRLAKETNKFLDERSGEQPFFAFLSFYAVHGPIQTTEEKWKKFQEKAKIQGIADKGFEMERVLPIRVVQDNPVYAGLIEHMDDAIGTVLRKLKAMGIADETIIVFTSDNGGVASGDAYSTTNLPLRGGKGYQWEGGVREPYFIKWPGKKGIDISFPVSGVDFYPTLLDLCGIDNPEIKKIDGISLVPLMKGEQLTERALFWHYPHYGNQGGEPASMIRKGKFKLIHYWEDGRNELYDLVIDPGEKNDIVEVEKDAAVTLWTELDSFLKSRRARIPELDSLYDPEKRVALMERRRTIVLNRLEEQRLGYLDDQYTPNATWWDSKPIAVDD
jgi:arylsulfatase A-like enzyme